ncbi:MAG: SDR family oxidoreductase, partial [Rickettsiales bacterium]
MLDRLKFAGAPVVVTGGGQGIGRATCEVLAELEAHVIVVSRTAANVDETVAILQAAGAFCEGHVADVSSLEEVEALAARVAERHDSVKAVVNNAGTNRPKHVLEVTEEDYDAVMDLNLKSAFFTAKAAASRMAEQNVKGSLIHLGSQMGHVGGENRSLYCASKWALEGFNKSLALDLSPHGIRSNIIAPTFIETPLTSSF